MVNKAFQGLLYPNNSADSLPVDIFVENNNLKLEYSGNSISLPVNHANFALGGEADSFLVITGRDITIFTKDVAIFDALIENSDYKFQEIKELKIKYLNRKKHSKLTPLYLVVTLIVIIGILYGALYATTVAISHSFPLSWEKKLGDMAAPQIVGTKKVDDKTVTKAIEEIGQHMEIYSDNKNYKFKYYVVKSDEVNAFAIPGGHVIVNTALIEKSDSYEEVAGVIAHELQHVYQRHSIEKLVNQLGVSFTLMMLFGDIGGIIDSVGGGLLGLKFSRDEESEADRLGLELMYKSGIKPEGMISFFKKLDGINEEASNLPDFISTHPNTKKRIEDLDKLVKTKYSNPPNKKVFTFNWKDIKAKTKAL